MDLIAQVVYERDSELYYDIRAVLGTDTWGFEKMYDTYCSSGRIGLKRFFVIEESVERELFNKLVKIFNVVKNEQLTDLFETVVNNSENS